MRTTVAIVIVLAALISGCSNSEKLQAEVDELRASTQTLSNTVDQLTDELRQLRGELAVVYEYVNALPTSQDVISATQAVAADTRRALDSADDAWNRAQEVANCVNDYMDVIGRWSSSINSYYSWNYC